MAVVGKERIEELRARLEARKRQLEAERQRKLELAREIYRELERLGMWWLLRLVGSCRAKRHGEWCELETGSVKLGLDTYNGFIHMWISGRLAFMGADEKTIVIYMRDLGLAEKALSWLRSLPDWIGELAKLAWEAGYYDGELMHEAIIELKRALEGVADDG